jgi:hypothetical protein
MTTHPERVEVCSTVELQVQDRDAADQLLQKLGSLRLDSEYDEARGQLSVRAAGPLTSLQLLEQVFEPQVPMTSIVQIEPIERAFADSLVAHFVAAARNHPQGGVPLSLDSDYDAGRQRLCVTLRGSVFAIGYFAMIIDLRLTQRVDRGQRQAG